MARCNRKRLRHVLWRANRRRSAMDHLHTSPLALVDELQEDRASPMRRTYLGLSIIAGALIAHAGFAHHSPVMFDQAKPLTLTGTVREFQWTNPHSYIQLVVKNEQGQDEEWSLEMAAPTYLYNLGWRPSTVKAGDVVTV